MREALFFSKINFEIILKIIDVGNFGIYIKMKIDVTRSIYL